MTARTRTAIAWCASLAAAGVVLAAAQQQPPAAAPQAPPPDPATCAGLLANAAGLPGLLSAVPRYGSSYVLVVSERQADTITAPDAPGVKTVQAGVHAGTPAVDLARTLGITNVKEYPLQAAAPIQPLRDIKEGTLDAAIMWAPLASLGIIELELDGHVQIFTVDKPHDPPAPLRAARAPAPCADAIVDLLDANGVLPAELLTNVDIRTMLARRPPAFDLEQAEAGHAVYNQWCSKCHGVDAVADPQGLAPVDLRLSVGRFSYPGFVFIILNGRPERSMPPLRGTVSQDEIALIYQYLKARTDRLLPRTGQ